MDRAAVVDGVSDKDAVCSSAEEGYLMVCFQTGECFAGGEKKGIEQIDDDRPYGLWFELIIGMAKSVADPANAAPVEVGHFLLSKVAELYCCLRQSLKAALRRVHCPPIC